MAALVADARAAGVKNAIRAGIRSIEHGIYLDDEAIELMLTHGTWLVPTLVAPRAVLAAAAGVRIAMGTDSGVGPHGNNLDELPLLVECGLTPTQALTAATSSAAELLGIDGQLGRLAAGARADIVAVSGNIDTLDGLASRITGVWQDGARQS